MREGAARKPLLFISFCSFVPFQIPTPVFFCGHTEKPRHRPAGFPRRRWRRKDDLTPRTAHHFRPTTAGTSLNGRHALAHRLRRDLPAALTSSSNRAAPLANPVNQSINALTPDIFCESLRGAGPGQATPRGSRNPLQQQHQCRSVRSVLFLLCSSFSLSRCTRWENMFKKNRCSPLFSFFFPSCCTSLPGCRRHIHRCCGKLAEEEEGVPAPLSGARCDVGGVTGRAAAHIIAARRRRAAGSTTARHYFFVCMCVRVSFFFLLFSVHWAKALVGHWCTTGETKTGPARQRAASATEELFLLLCQDKPRRRNVSLRDGAPHQLLLLLLLLPPQGNGSAGREDRGRRAREKREETLGCRHHRAAGTTAPDDDGAWAF